jgi:hypothetical protein
MPGHHLKTREGYNLMQQLSISAFVCTLALLSFLPYILNMELYDEDPDTPYSGGADDTLIDIVNAVLVACTSMMFLEALLDSNSRYLPIKVAFPRFIMVFGVLCTCLALYSQDIRGIDRLNFLICSHYAKTYFLCGGIFLRLVRDAAKRGSYLFCVYVFGVIMYTIEMLLRQWGAYYDKSDSFVILQHCVTATTLMYGAYFAYRAVKLCPSLTAKGGSNIGYHYYDVMSHTVICIFVVAAYVINMLFGFQMWKNTSAAEMAAYSFLGLSATMLFFCFSSSSIAQRHFLMAKVGFQNYTLVAY